VDWIYIRVLLVLSSNCLSKRVFILFLILLDIHNSYPTLCIKNGRFFVYLMINDFSTVWTTHFRQKSVLACLVQHSRVHDFFLCFLKSDVISQYQWFITHNAWRWTSVHVANNFTPGTMWTTWFDNESTITDLLLHSMCCWNCVVKIVYFFYFWNHMTHLIESTRQVQRCFFLDQPALYNAPGLRDCAGRIACQDWSAHIACQDWSVHSLSICFIHVHVSARKSERETERERETTK